MKKFENFLENIGLKNTSTGEKKPLGKMITLVALVILAIFGLTIANNLIKNATPKKTKQEIQFNLKGTSTMVLYINQEYNEPGYEAINEYGNDVSNRVIVVGNVDTSKAGIYEINYKLTINNVTYVKTRTITITDQSQIMFTLLGEKEVTIKQGEKYIDEGYEVIIPGENEPEKYVTVTSNVDETKLGKYQITYRLNHLNISKELIRTINVVE